MTITERDRPLLKAAGGELLRSGWTARPDEVRARLDKAQARGATEVLYAPAGPDIPRELEAFARATQRS